MKRCVNSDHTFPDFPNHVERQSLEGSRSFYLCTECLAVKVVIVVSGNDPEYGEVESYTSQVVEPR